MLRSYLGGGLLGIVDVSVPAGRRTLVILVPCEAHIPYNAGHMGTASNRSAPTGTPTEPPRDRLPGILIEFNPRRIDLLGSVA